MIGLLSLLLLNAGGVQSLQTMTLITALPFSIIMCMFCYSLIVGLRIDHAYYAKGYSPAASNWSGEFWKARLDHILSYKNEKDVAGFMKEYVQPALTELSEEFQRRGIIAEVISANSQEAIELKIRHEVIDDFMYGVRIQLKMISDFLVEEINIPGAGKNKIYIPLTYFGDNRKGYNIEYFSKKEIIADVLKQYERYIELSSDIGNEMFLDNTFKEQKPIDD